MKLAKRAKTILSKNDGVASYIEFVLSFCILAFVFYTIVSIYFLISAQILVVNTTKSALRQIEIYGEVRQEIIDNVNSSLSKVSQIKSSPVITVSDPNNINSMIPARSGIVYQFRKPLKVSISATYSFTIINPSLSANLMSINLSSSYSGASERFDKDLPAYEIINE